MLQQLELYNVIQSEVKKPYVLYIFYMKYTNDKFIIYLFKLKIRLVHYPPLHHSLRTPPRCPLPRVL